MQIQLNQREIEDAVKMYVEDQGIALGDKTVSINFTAGRGATGLTADVDIQRTGNAPVRTLNAVRTEELKEEVQEEKDDPEPQEAEAPKAAVSLFG